MAKIINIANFKGGVGKTTTTVLFSYLLAVKKGKKVLLVDFDPQANATSLIFKTFSVNYDDVNFTIYEAIKDKDLSKAVVKCHNNLDIISSEGDLRNFPRLLSRLFGDDYSLYPYLLDALLEPLKSKYDYIFIDVPPTISDYTDSAIVASDYLAIVMQTQEFSLQAVEDFLPYVEEVLDTYQTNIKFVATFPVLFNTRGKTDELILSEAKRLFGDRLTENKILIRERVKGWMLLGIRDEDTHDREALDMYENLLDEFLEKMEW